MTDETTTCDEMTETIETDQMKTTAAMMAHGFPLAGTRTSHAGRRVNFQVEIPFERAEEGHTLLANCRRGLHVEVDLHAYDRNMQDLRLMVKTLTGDNHDRRSHER